MQTRMVYFVAADRTIVRAEAHVSEESAALDPVFGYPFPVDAILGRDLFSFIAGIEVQHIYALLQDCVLDTGRTIGFDYRCDSPAVRRDMRMAMNRDDGMVRYESVVLREMLRRVPLPAPSEGASVLIVICSNCHRYRFPADSPEWREIEALLAEPELPARFGLTHTLCEPCYERLMNEALEETGAGFRDR